MRSTERGSFFINPHRRKVSRGKGRWWCTRLFAFALAALGTGTSLAGERLEILARVGPWPAVSGLIGYGDRLWLVNSVKFVNHNSADLYSYDPARGTIRYERHLFSQDAGDPVVAGGLLFWPFEDPRFSTGRGEYMLTNGRDWRWRLLRDGRAFHVHAMAALGATLYAATSAWRAGLQRSDDLGRTWRVVYDHPTAPGRVTRVTKLAPFGTDIYAGLTDWNGIGARLLRSRDGAVRPVPGWPDGHAVTALQAFAGWLYGVNVTSTGRAVWRTDGTSVERVDGLEGVAVRDLADGAGALWAVSANAGGGALWRSADGVDWSLERRFLGAEPVDIAVYAERVYVGTIGPDGLGALWGPPPPAPTEIALPRTSLPERPPSQTPGTTRTALAALDRLLMETSNDASPPPPDNGGKPETADFRASLLRILRPLALAGASDVGLGLTRRLDGPFPVRDAPIFGDKARLPAARIARWYLLWAIAASTTGRVPPALLTEPWTAAPNGPEKYFHPAEAAAWAIGRLGQRDSETFAALIARLGRTGDPEWLEGDLVGALTLLSGKRFGYDAQAWRAWWRGRDKGR